MEKVQAVTSAASATRKTKTNKNPLKMKTPLVPKLVAQAAIKAGLLKRPEDDYDSPTVTLPESRPPKVDARCGKRILRGDFRKRYVLTKAQAIAKGYKL